MPSKQIKLPGKGIHSFEFEEELLLFDEHTQKLLLLNSTAKAVWKGLESGLTIDEIVQILALAARREPGQILSDVNSIISQWQDLGFFNSVTQKKALHQAAKIRQDNFIEMKRTEETVCLPEMSHNCIFQVIDTTFRFTAPDQCILDLVTQTISHLLIDIPGPPDIELSLVKTDRRYLLYKNKKPVDFCSRIDGVAPMLHAMVLMTAYDRSDCLMGLHAAAIIKGRTCILLPAGSGSGKTTLTAALIHSGFTYGADDLVLLTSTPGRVIPVPTALGIKQGSWPIIEKYHVKIHSVPIHRRSDNKLIKYLPPFETVNRDFYSSLPIKVDCIVYPDYKSDNPVSLDRISPAQSVCSLSTAGFDMHERFDRESVQKLVEWLKSTPSYRLGFSRLEDGVSCIQSL